MLLNPYLALIDGICWIMIVLKHLEILLRARTLPSTISQFNDSYDDKPSGYTDLDVHV